MTAEIAVLNREAVALAADSAVTISLPNGYKILPSANKIFSLSKYHPVGVMIYGNAQLVEVPWEVIIKEYRRQLGTRPFDTLDGYATNFIEYLSASPAFFPDTSQERAFLIDAQNVYAMILEQFEEGKAALAAVNRAEGKPAPSEDDERALLATYITTLHSAWRGLSSIDKLPTDFGTRVRTQHAVAVRALIRELFTGHSLTRSATNKLIDLAVWFAERYPVKARPGHSGLVIAGFGTNDVFAGLRSFHISGIVCGSLVYTDDRPVDVATAGSAILPFAQDEMVSAFMEGIDKRFLESIRQSVSEILTGITSHATTISGLGPKKRKQFQDELDKGREALMAHFRTEMDRVRRENFWSPVVRVAAMLPKTELASMAEALVNLTSFKRKVSEEAETVGGPIDVAVISKGDGFIWVKRKHYFSRDLNPQFFANYYREEADASKETGD